MEVGSRLAVCAKWLRTNDLSVLCYLLQVVLLLEVGTWVTLFICCFKVCWSLCYHQKEKKMIRVLPYLGRGYLWNLFIVFCKLSWSTVISFFFSFAIQYYIVGMGTETQRTCILVVQFLVTILRFTHKFLLGRSLTVFAVSVLGMWGWERACPMELGDGRIQYHTFSEAMSPWVLIL